MFTPCKFLMTHSTKRRYLLKRAFELAAVLSSLPVLPTSAQPQTGPLIKETDLGYLWLLQGAGCNVLAMPGGSEDGFLLMDGGLAEHSPALLEAAMAVTGQERIHTLINSHFHPDHTGSNLAAGVMGAQIVAHENTMRCLEVALESSSYEGRYGPLPDYALPNKTLKGDGSFKFAGQELIYGYLPAAHTNGDIFIYMPMLDTLFTGGAVTSDSWPLLDIRQGAWMGGLMEAYDKLYSVVSADTVVIPAQGAPINGAAIVRMRNMYSELHLSLTELLNIGMGWDDVVALNPLQKYEAQYGSAARFLELAMRSIQLAYVPD